MTCDGCCTYPHGRLSIYATILGISSYLFAASSTSGCSYVRTTLNFSERLSTTGERAININGKHGLGIFAYEDAFRNSSTTFVCNYYSEAMLNHMDGAYMTSRAFGMLANICMGVGALLIILSACFGYTSTAIKGIAGLFFAGSVFIMLTMIFFASDLCEDDCSFSYDAGMVIVAFVLGIITGVVVGAMPEQGPLNSINNYDNGGMEQPQPFAPGTQTVTETKMPDGSKKIVKTTVNADGSQTVEQTIVSP